MRKFLALLPVLVLLSYSPAALAFSVDQQSGRNDDGSAKFADPDEQMPNLVARPSEDPSQIPSSSSTAGQVTLPSLQENDRGAAAFDQAYSHLQNR